MASVADSKPMMATTTLPPPYSYEEMYASYQNEWDQESKIADDDKTDGIDTETSVSNLQWVTFRDETYLLACTTNRGQIIVWKLAKQESSQPLLVKHGWWTLSKDDDDDKQRIILNELCIISTEHNVANRRSRKRQRSEEEHELLLVAAASNGLWRVPLSEILLIEQEQQKQALCIPKAFRLSDRSIFKLQHHSSSATLFALEQNASHLLVWNVHTIDSADSSLPPSQEIDLSCFFSKKKPRKHRPIESATTLMVGNSGQNKACLLVGTDRASVWILPMTTVTKDNDLTWIIECTRNENGLPRCLSLHDTKNAPQNTATSKKNHHNDGWKVTDICETQDGTWWTASAVRTSTATKTTTTGLIMTWHASSGILVARTETREAIQRIVLEDSSSFLYSVGNEEAVSVWESHLSLEKRTCSKSWVSPPSSKTIAIADDNNNKAMAIAGVGNTVDLFLDRCRIQTVKV